MYVYIYIYIYICKHGLFLGKTLMPYPKLNHVQSLVNIQ